jgi:beta-phosphoglucomutase-like phosphatase (HAD superfamily)
MVEGVVRPTNAQVQNDEVVVFEDSPNAVTAAGRAGICVLAVPNQPMPSLPIEGANLIRNSFSELPLSLLIDKVK